MPKATDPLKDRFRGSLTPAEATQALRDAMADIGLPGLARIEAASALLDLQSGRSVQSTMARFRRAIGLDPAKPKAGA